MSDAHTDLPAVTSPQPTQGGSGADAPSQVSASALQAASARPAGPVITVIEPDAIAPLDRLGEWLFAAGARLRTVRLWKGEELPALDDLGDGVVILGGAMSAHDGERYPWIAQLHEIVRTVVARQQPTLAICLGAQIAAEALGGHVDVPAGAGEHGVVELDLTQAAGEDRVLALVIDEAVRAAVRAGISTQDGTRLPVLVSHNDAVARLPQGATLLASSPASPIHTWRMGRMLAFQHHPEASPARMAAWAQRDALDALGVDDSTATLPIEAVAAGRRARAEAEKVDAVVMAYGRTLARELVRHARAYAATRAA